MAAEPARRTARPGALTGVGAAVTPGSAAPTRRPPAPIRAAARPRAIPTPASRRGSDGDGLHQHDQVEIAAVEREPQPQGRVEHHGPVRRRRRVPGEEILVLLHISEQGERDEVGGRVAPEHPLPVDDPADRPGPRLPVDEQIALPQVEVDEGGPGDVVEDGRRSGEQRADRVRRARQPSTVRVRVGEHRVRHGGERLPPGRGQRAQRLGRVAESAGPGDGVQPPDEPPQFMPEPPLLAVGQGRADPVPGLPGAGRHDQVRSGRGAGIEPAVHHTGDRDVSCRCRRRVEGDLVDQEVALVAHRRGGRRRRYLHHPVPPVGERDAGDGVVRAAGERAARRDAARPESDVVEDGGDGCSALHVRAPLHRLRTGRFCADPGPARGLHGMITTQLRSTPVPELVDRQTTADS